MPSYVEPENQPTQIRGPAVSAALGWVRQSFGEEVLARAFLRLPAQEKSSLERMILSLGWYPLAAMERMLDAVFIEANITTGISREEFDRRGTQEGGSSLIRTLYKFFLSVSGTESVIARLPMLSSRIYSRGSLELLKNDRGSFAMRQSFPMDAYAGILRNIKYGYAHTISLTGARDVALLFMNEERTLGSFVIESEWSYR